MFTLDLTRARWVKSSYSANNGNCVELANDWVKSSYSANNGECLELAGGPAWAAVRDSKNPAGPALVFTPDAVSALLRTVRERRVR